MASGIFALFDDIAMLADDVAMTTKIATKKAAGLLSDDLAVNAEKAMGFDQSRELKVVWAITKGSFINKLIILPLAFLLNYFAPWAITLALILGALYLLFEGFEKSYEVLFEKNHEVKEERKKELQKTTSENILEVEKKKIKSAIMTDFILSIEIVVITLSTVLNQPILVQIATTSIVSILATIGVYGVVALIIRLDNVGFWLIKKGYREFGQFLVDLMPKLINALSVIGTIAMILVGGGILSHNVEFFHHYFFSFLPNFINEIILGVIIGAIVFFIIKSFKGVLNR